jgi:hypothetical protein
MTAEAHAALARGFLGGLFGPGALRGGAGGAGGGGSDSPVFALRVRRSHILTDTLNQIASAHPAELHKQMKVAFVGEEAVDAGGPTKELFVLLTRELLDDKYALWRS